jgi:hypothetical protein
MASCKNRRRHGGLPVTWLLILVIMTGSLLAGCSAAERVSKKLFPGVIRHLALADTGSVSLNRSVLQSPPQAFRFAVVGHIYGSEETDNIDPALHLVERIPDLNDMHLSMLALLGDMVRNPQTADFDRLDQTLLSKLDFPVFNAVGNHDVMDRVMYQNRYGETYYNFTYGPALMLFLDTEQDECTVAGRQRDMIEQATAQALKDKAVKEIFIFMHRTYWLQNQTLFDLQNPLASPNSWKCYGSDFRLIMDHTLAPASRQKPVYIFSGDVGKSGNLTPYYERLSSAPITLAAAGLGDNPRDGLILVSVDGGQVDLQFYSLVAGSLGSIERYTPAYWEAVARGAAP